VRIIPPSPPVNDDGPLVGPYSFTGAGCVDGATGQFVDSLPIPGLLTGIELGTLRDK
jgi:hypothetical protein